MAHIYHLPIHAIHLDLEVGVVVELGGYHVGRLLTLITDVLDSNIRLNTVGDFMPNHGNFVLK